MTQSGSPFDPESFTPPPPPQLRNSRKQSTRTGLGAVGPGPRRTQDASSRRGFSNPTGKGSRTSGGRSGAGARWSARGLWAAWRGASVLIKVLIPVVVGITLAIIVRMFFVQTFTVPSASMAPTLVPGDRIVTQKFSYMLGQPRAGDIVVFRTGPGWEGTSGEKFFVKRVIGVAGDTIKCCDAKGRVLVNGSPQHESYVGKGQDEVKFGPVKVTKNQLFVMGDNRDNSYDSRFRGPISLDQVVGRVEGRFWPLDHLGLTGRS